MTKLLVLYVFHIYNNRVEHFINNSIFYDENVDFIVISNNKNNNFEVPPFVKKMFRDNVGYDFGGWSEALLTNNCFDVICLFRLKSPLCLCNLSFNFLVVEPIYISPLLLTNLYILAEGNIPSIIL